MFIPAAELRGIQINKSLRFGDDNIAQDI